jgi:hypothetical protein
MGVASNLPTAQVQAAGTAAVAVVVLEASQVTHKRLVGPVQVKQVTLQATQTAVGTVLSTLGAVQAQVKAPAVPDEVLVASQLAHNTLVAPVVQVVQL